MVNSLVNLRAAVEEKDPSHYRHLLEVGGMKEDEFRERTKALTQEIIRDVGELKKKLYEEGFRAGMKSFEEGARAAMAGRVQAPAAPVMHIDYEHALNQRAAALEEKLLGRITANTNYIASEVKRREEEFKGVAARLREELDAIKGVADRVKKLEEGLGKAVKKPLKALEARISEMDHRIDSQLIGSVIGAKQLNEKIAEAEKRIVAQVKAAPETAEKLAAIEKQLAAFDGKKLLKQIAAVRKNIRGVEQRISAVDNRIDSQLIGSVIGAKQLNEKIAEAEKRIMAAVKAPAPLKAKIVKAAKVVKAKAAPAKALKPVLKPKPKAPAKAKRTKPKTRLAKKERKARAKTRR